MKKKVKKKRILIVDDEKKASHVLEKILSFGGYQVFKAKDGEEALRKAKEVTPDLILLDIMMPKMKGTDVKRKLDKEMKGFSIPVIFLTGKDTTLDKVTGLKLGADDYITKPFDIEEFLARVNAVLNRRQFYEDISMTDGLTGLYNVHFLKKQFKIVFNAAERDRQIFSLAIIDVDKLKSINDTYGHAAGDFVLRKVAKIMKTTLRKSDIITRYGGDEFSIILPGVNKKGAKISMERVKKMIEEEEFIYKKTGAKLDISVSIGIATYGEDFSSEAQAFELADAKMYKDKKKKALPAQHI